MGSGVIVDAKNGHIITNNHVVEGADQISIVLMDEREFDAEVLATDPKSDLAILKIDAKNLTQVTLGNSDNLDVGEWVLAIGSPFSSSLSHTVTAGIVSAKGRTNVIGGIDYEDFISRLFDTGYEGWIVVEAEQDPKKANPLKYAKKGYNSLELALKKTGYEIEV